MTNPQNFGLPTQATTEIKKTLANYGGIEKAIIYGSRAMGNFKPGSDIDLCLVAPGLALSDLLKIENIIDDLLLPYKVDLSFEHSIENSDLLEHIKNRGVVFWRRPGK